MASVGTALLGAGRWGQLDLAGEVFEWTADWYAQDDSQSCTDCVNLVASSAGAIDMGFGGRVARGGSFEHSAVSLGASAVRNLGDPIGRDGYIGFRCARTP